MSKIIRSGKSMFLFSSLTLAQIVVLRAIAKDRTILKIKTLYLFLLDMQNDFFTDGLSFSENDLLQVCYSLSILSLVEVKEGEVWARPEGKNFIDDLDLIINAV